MIPREISEKLEYAAGDYSRTSAETPTVGNSFVNGAEALFQLLQERAVSEFSVTWALIACGECSDRHKVQGFVEGARWKHDQTKAALAAARVDRAECVERTARGQVRIKELEQQLADRRAMAEGDDKLIKRLEAQLAEAKNMDLTAAVLAKDVELAAQRDSAVQAVRDFRKLLASIAIDHVSGERTISTANSRWLDSALAATKQYEETK